MSYNDNRRVKPRRVTLRTQGLPKRSEQSPKTYYLQDHRGLVVNWDGKVCPDSEVGWQYAAEFVDEVGAAAFCSVHGLRLVPPSELLSVNLPKGLVKKLLEKHVDTVCSLHEDGQHLVTTMLIELCEEYDYPHNKLVGLLPHAVPPTQTT